MTSNLSLITKTADAEYYAFSNNTNSFRRFIFSTKETRSVLNDTSLLGVQYTDKLQKGITQFFTHYKNFCNFPLQEKKANILCFLRGGLNFELRNALYNSYKWNTQGSTFLSSQRSVDENGRWYIHEDSYTKVTVPKGALLICGDVIATGVTLDHGLEKLTQRIKGNKGSITRLLFFTIGCHKAEKVLQKYEEIWKKTFADFEGIDLVYIEGKFHLADTKTDATIKILGTDLLRKDSIMAPMFIESQYENILYPLERCVIYDAGSRAFDIEEYSTDVKEYWQEVSALAEKGITTEQYLQERMPELDIRRFGDIPELKDIAERNIKQ